MEVMFARKDVRRWQAHERQLRSIRTASNGPFPDGHSGASDRLTRVFDDVRMAIENLAHVPVLFFDQDLDSGAVPRRCFQRQPLEQLLLLFERRRLEVTDDQPDTRSFAAALQHVRVDEPVVAVRALG